MMLSSLRQHLSATAATVALLAMFSAQGVRSLSAQTTPVVDPFLAVQAGLAAGAGTTVCATGIPTFKGPSSGGVNEGDGCVPTQAILSAPSSTAIDAFNNLYISDYNDRLVRVIYQGGANLTAALIAASPSITNFTPIPGRIYTLAGGISAALTQTTSTGGSKAYYCNQAGSGTVALGSNGDGCPATEAYIQPRGMQVDSNGNIFVANLGGGEGFRVIYAGGAQVAALITTLNPTVTAPQVGYIYSLAGTSTAGFSGDGSNARSAQFENVRDVTVDASGNIYLSDGNSAGSTTNSDVRVINGTTGVITTVVAGAATKVAACPTTGTNFGGDGGPASSALVNSPYAIFLDANQNLYIADSCNGRLRVIYAAGTLPNVAGPLVPGNIYTVAGGGTLVGASGVAATQLNIALLQSAGIDAFGNIYFADATNREAWQMNPTTGTATLIAGIGATGTSPALGSFCNGVAGPTATDSDGDGCPAVESVIAPTLRWVGDTQGNVYNEESGLNITRKYALNNVFPATTANTSATQGIALLSASTTPTFTSEGAPSTEFTATTPVCTAVVTGAQPLCVYPVTFAPVEAGAREGALRVTASGTTPVVFLSGVGVSAGAAVDPGTTSTIGSALKPAGVAVDTSFNTYVSDATSNSVIKYAPGATAGTTLLTGLSSAHQVAVDGNGDVFVADTGNNRIRELPASGTAVSIGTGLSAPQGVAVDSYGNVFIADTGNKRVVEVPRGTASQIVVPLTGLASPTRLAVDAAGDLFVVDTGNKQIIELPTGVGGVQTVVNLGTTSASPVAVAVDAAGDVFYADSATLNVTGVFTGGSISDNLVTGLKTPSDLAIDPNASLYVADSSATSVTEVNRSLGTAAFPLTNVSTSSTATLTVTNAGNAALLFNGASFATFTGTGAADFSIASGATNGCTMSNPVAAAGQCQLTATFTPATRGTFTAKATLVTNAVTPTPAAATLTGTGAQLISTTTAATITSPTGATTAIPYGTSVTVSLVVTPSNTSAGTPTGTITPTVDGKSQTAVPYGTGSTTLTVTLGVGTHVVCGVYSGDANYASSSNCVSFTIVKASTTTALAVSVNGSGSLPQLVLTAAVTPAAATGTVSFYVGSVAPANLLGTVTLASGVATYKTNTLIYSSYNFIAVYSGDANYSPSTSVTVTPPGDFVLNASSNALATAQGGVASIAITVTPLFGASTTLTPGCSGLPANAVCRFQPNVITLSGSTAQGVQLEVFTNVSANVAANREANPSRIVMAFLLPFGATVLLFARRRRNRWMTTLCLLLMLGGSMAALSGCATTTPVYTTPQGSTPLTVSFTSSAATPVTHNLALTLTVD